MLNKGKILVVDDNFVNRDLLEKRLKKMDHTVVLAETGEDALKVLDKEGFDVVLLDIMMPGIDGVTVLKIIKNNPEINHIPILMISSMTSADLIAECIKLGAEDYLTKPFNSVVLNARISSCLQKKFFYDKQAEYLEEIEKERGRSDELLKMLFPEPVIFELKDKGKYFPRVVHGVAVIFIDVVGFTSFCSNSSPLEIYSNLQEMVGAFEAICKKRKMEKVKTIGDCFMCTSGLLYKQKNPVLEAIEGVYEMIEASSKFSSGWKVRTGVHYGSVMTGIVGTQSFQFDIWGDTVNTAARLESKAKTGSIIISEEAYKKVEGQVKVDNLGPIEIQGKGKLNLYSVLELSSANRL